MIGSFFARDKVSLIKMDGTRHDEIQASVQDRRVYIYRHDIFIEAGDFLIRKMSNGGEERLRVVDPCFYEGGSGIGPHYQVKVEKITTQSSTTRAPLATTVNYNFHAANARVNHNSVDQSTNVVGDHAVIHDHIAELRQAIKAAQFSEEGDRKEAFDVVDTIEEQFKTGKPKRSVMKALLASLPQIADIAKLGAELIDLCN